MKAGGSATQYEDKFQEFVSDGARKRIYERESLATEAAELVSCLMEREKVSKAELARRIGKSRSYVTQLLNGSRNMTVHTLADLAYALGSRVEIKARTCRQAQGAEADAVTTTIRIYRFWDQSSRATLRQSMQAQTEPSAVSFVGTLGA